jgi:hypothetical protein
VLIVELGVVTAGTTVWGNERIPEVGEVAVVGPDDKGPDDTSRSPSATQRAWSSSCVEYGRVLAWSCSAARGSSPMAASQKARRTVMPSPKSQTHVATGAPDRATRRISGTPWAASVIVPRRAERAPRRTRRPDTAAPRPSPSARRRRSDAPGTRRPPPRRSPRDDALGAQEAHEWRREYAGAATDVERALPDLNPGDLDQPLGELAAVAANSSFVAAIAPVTGLNT